MTCRCDVQANRRQIELGIVVLATLLGASGLQQSVMDALSQ